MTLWCICIDRWQEELAKIGEAGGNSVRVWVHVEGDVRWGISKRDDKNLTVSHSSPLYDGDGYVTGTDSAGSLVADLRAFLDECAAHNILAGLVLFNGAVLLDHNL